MTHGTEKSGETEEGEDQPQTRGILSPAWNFQEIRAQGGHHEM
jgi:hypothetical protein